MKNKIFILNQEKHQIFFSKVKTKNKINKILYTFF
jgi:hypothetical protein